MNFQICLTLLCAMLFALSNLSAAEKLNVVLFVVDDMGLDAGCYGNKAIQTPNIDALAAGGTRFTRAFCTASSCSASRSVILSGLHNHANGQYGLQHSTHHFASFSSVRSLPVILGENGYRTARIGKFHVAPEETYKFQTVLTGNQGGPRNSVTMAEKCRDFIADKEEKPFFLYFCTTDPHRGGGIVKEHPLKPDAFGNTMKYEGVNEVVYDPKQVVLPEYLSESLEARAELAQYYQSISRLDQGLGKLVQVLKDAGKFDSTVILFISDNGPPFPGSKTTLYEPGLKLPLIVRSPDQQRRGGVCNAMISWVDLTPTILDYAGVHEVKGRLFQGELEGSAPARKKQAEPALYTFHGKSFREVLDVENPPGWNEIYASHQFHEITMYYPMRSLRTPQFKLLYNIANPLPYPFAADIYDSATWQGILRRNDTMMGPRRTIDFIQRPRWELYDVQADPNETKNLASEPKYAATLSEMQAKLKAFQERTRDPWLMKYRYE